MMKLLDRLLGRPSCGHVMEILQAYLDGEVDAEQAKAVAHHLDRCAGCGPEAEIYRKLIVSIQRQTPPPEAESLERLQLFVATLGDD